MSPNRRNHAARGLGTVTIIVLIVLVACLAMLGIALRPDGNPGSGEGRPDLYEARRGSFDITVPASGELAALRVIEIASQLEVRATITEIVDEGVNVKKGDVLIRLDDEEIRNRIKDVEVAVKNAETAWTTAVSDLEILRRSGESQLSLADVDIRLAELALKAWEEGNDLSRQQTLALDVETNKKDYDRLVARFEASAELLAQEFISQDEYDRDEIEMIRAKSRYEQAQLAQQVYLDYEREQELARLTSDLKRVQDKREEIEQTHRNELTTKETSVENRLVALRREQERLDLAKRQLGMCTILAPQDGLVVYASSLQTGRWGRNEQTPPQVGTELPRNRTVIVLPDTSEMVAEVKVNEALSGKIQAGQTAIVYSDALPDTPLQGTVRSVGVLAESGGWRDPNRRDYTVRIALDHGADLGLKPAMRCRANIFVGRVEEAIHVPVQAVFREGRQAFVYVPAGSNYAPRPVTLGRASELFIEIASGLEEGERVLLRAPSAERIDDAEGDAADEAKRPSAGAKRGSGGGRPG